MSNVVIISTGQPATNPRAVKEAIGLAENGYQVTFIYSFWVEWGIALDKKIIEENPGINWVMAGSDPVGSRIAYVFSRVRHKFSRLLARLFPRNIWLAQEAVMRGFPALCHVAANVEAGLYIAHNLGALPAAARAAKNTVPGMHLMQRIITGAR